MANVITSPLDTILQGFLGSFNTTFLAFALLTGYLTFFLFFYGTKKWKSIDWVERFFFGFLFGMFSSLVFVIFLFSPIEFIIQTTYTDNTTTTALYGGPILFLVFLSFLRVYYKVPLCSKEMKEKFLETLSNKRMYASIIMFLFSGILVGGILLNNPFFSTYNSMQWLNFFIYLNFGMFAYFILLLNFVLGITSLSGDLHPLRFFFITVDWYFAAIPSKVMPYDEGTKRSLRKDFKKIIKKRAIKKVIKTRLFKAMAIALLFLVLGISFDRAYGVISPSLQVIDSIKSDTKYIEVYRFDNGSFIYLQKMSQVYLIRLPMINLRNFNISISNPSNLIEEDTRNINSRYISPLSTTVVCNDSFQYTTTRDIRGINSFDIMPINDSRQPIEHSNITLRYYNKANLDLIEIRDPMEKRLENGSILITTSLTITNNQNAQLSFQQIPVIPLYYFNNLGNVTSFTWKTTVDNSSYNTSNYQIADSWLWSPSFNVFPNQVMHINIQAVFEEKTNA